MRAGIPSGCRRCWGVRSGDGARASRNQPAAMRYVKAAWYWFFFKSVFFFSLSGLFWRAFPLRIPVCLHRLSLLSARALSQCLMTFQVGEEERACPIY